MRDGIPLGLFTLHRPIADGGMAQIWLGEHTATAFPVAVKVLTAEQFRVDAFRDALRNEVFAMARLDHRGIVPVIDQGAVDPLAARASASGLVDGSPYLVMEYVPGPVLSARPPSNYSQLHRLLLLMLDALAHAHARGIVHRDLKPANVLLDPDVARTGGVRLVDFGIASAVERAFGEAEEVAGTVAYMAPEQCDARTREQGPWTDLYAVGCVAWELATGAPPFSAETTIELIDRQIDEDPPAFEPRFDVPLGLEGWLRTLLRKDPFDRPRYAADAARLLRADAPGDASLSDVGLTVTEGLRAVSVARRPADDLGLETLTLPAVSAVGAGIGKRLSLSWRRAHRDAPPPRLPGAGLGLWGLRQPPLAGREGDLDALWGALAGVHASGSAGAVVLAGDLGVGTSRIARWICERALELGVADVLWALHAPSPRPSDGLGRLAARELQAIGLSGSLLRQHLADVLVRRRLSDPSVAEREAEALAAHVLSVGEEGARHDALFRLVRRLARHRPVIVWIDDAQWADPAVRFARTVLRAQAARPSPILFILTADTSAEGPCELESLRADPGLHHRFVRPLPNEDHDRLVRSIGLDGVLGEKVARRTAGNPLFAVQLVDDWVRQGVLAPRRSGLRLKDDAILELPDDLDHLWRRRFERVLADLPPSAEWHLALAAAAGGLLERADVARLAGTGTIEPVPGFEAAMIGAQLAVPSRGGLSLSHEAARRSAERRARRLGLWQTARALAASMRGAARPDAKTEPMATRP